MTHLSRTVLGVQNDDLGLVMHELVVERAQFLDVSLPGHRRKELIDDGALAHRGDAVRVDVEGGRARGEDLVGWCAVLGDELENAWKRFGRRRVDDGSGRRRFQARPDLDGDKGGYREVHPETRPPAAVREPRPDTLETRRKKEEKAAQGHEVVVRKVTVAGGD